MSNTLVSTNAPESTPAISDKDLANLRYVISSEKVLANDEAKVTALTAQAYTYGAQSQKTSDELAVATHLYRRRFLAPQSVRTLLGDNEAPDLMGKSTDYAKSVERINAHAKEQAIEALVEQGWSDRLATREVTDEMERTRQRMSRAYRIRIERFAAKLGKEQGALFLLAYGFAYHQACGEGQLLKSGDTLGWPKSVEKSAQRISNALIVPKDHIITDKGTVEPKALPVGRRSAEDAQARETADAIINAMLKGGDVSIEKPLTNAWELVNLAIGLLDQAAALAGNGGFKQMTLNERNATRAGLLAATRAVAVALEGTPAPAKTNVLAGATLPAGTAKGSAPAAK